MKKEKIGNTTWITTQLPLFYEDLYWVGLATDAKRDFVKDGWLETPNDWAPGFPSFWMQYVMIDGWIVLMSRKIRWFDRCWLWLYERLAR